MRVKLDPRGGGTVIVTRPEVAAFRAECSDCGLSNCAIHVTFDHQDDIVSIEPESVERDGNVYAVMALIYDAYDALCARRVRGVPVEYWVSTHLDRQDVDEIMVRRRWDAAHRAFCEAVQQAIHLAAEQGTKRGRRAQEAIRKEACEAVEKATKAARPTLLKPDVVVGIGPYRISCSAVRRV